MQKNYLFTIVSILFFSISLFAQHPITFKEGMAVGATGKRSRSPIFTDPVYHKYVINPFVAPVENDSVGVNHKGEVQRWKKVTANEEGKFDNNEFRGGYLYLTYFSKKAETKILDISGCTELYINGTPRAGDVYNKNWMLLPVDLKAGENVFLIKSGRGMLKIELHKPEKLIYMSQRDMTIPDLITSESDEKLAAIRIINTSSKTLTNLKIVTEINGLKAETELPSITPLAVRKVPYSLKDAAVQTGKINFRVNLYNGNKLVDHTVVEYEAKQLEDKHVRTFISNIDGSLQYFAVVPDTTDNDDGKPAMFLSVHGAGVKAQNQAGAYKHKDWGYIICPTNRREFGFDWEDWGRLDAMEVQSIAEKMYKTDPKRTYLTGHSMGGHGTWQLGAIFPDKWAAIAPSAGWYSFFSYSNKQKIEDASPLEKMFVRASHSSHTLELSRNYLHHGVYIYHGDADKTVPVEQARFMRKHLAEFHPNFSYYEFPGGGHWFGSESVDWPPIFDYFSYHENPENTDVKAFEFRSASPGVSASSRFVTLYQQEIPYEFCGVKVKQNVLTEAQKNKEGSNIVKNRNITIETENLKQFKLDLKHCHGADTITAIVDSITFEGLAAKAGKEAWFKKVDNKWQLTDTPLDKSQKNPLRYGNFKDAFRYNMVFVYSTKGTKEENKWSYDKARFDAETFYYRGNGSIDIVSDEEFLSGDFQDRSVIIYGNASTNAAWEVLLNDSPIQVYRGQIDIGNKTFKGEQWASYFTRPRKDSDVARIGVVTGSGLTGFRAAIPNRYFISGTGFPDFMIFSPEMMKSGIEGIKAAGYFGNDWSLSNGEIEWTK